ncbi:hypothetical protein [Endozoicomonas sp. ONNA2]|uniref:hypothetical protein n=1 Tax=Endozoicomonas sp. ONNA2 TaxID=2828741 RepID=UPI0021490CFB|nr:hypothetical protein [Endozoicomonas sp. ONNA2]
MKLTENDLAIDFTDAIDGGTLVFDQMKPTQPNYHGLSEQHRVDFVVELEEAILFVEVKDPGYPRAQKEGLEKFHNEIENGTLSSTFANKFIDTFFYRWAERKLTKPVHYLSLVTLDLELNANLTDEITAKMPPAGRAVDRWQRSIYENCQVFNLEIWNENFPKWPATRISEVANQTLT